MPSLRVGRPEENVARAVADGMRVIVRRPLPAAATAATTAAQIPERALPVALPLLAVAVGSHASSGGWLLTVTSVGALAGTFAGGRLIDRLGPRAVMVVATVAAAPVPAALAVVPRSSRPSRWPGCSVR